MKLPALKALVLVATLSSFSFFAGAETPAAEKPVVDRSLFNLTLVVSRLSVVWQ